MFFMNVYEIRKCVVFHWSVFSLQKILRPLLVFLKRLYVIILPSDITYVPLCFTMGENISAKIFVNLNDQ